MKGPKIILILSLVLNVALGLYVVFRQTNPSADDKTESLSQSNMTYFLNRDELFDVLPKDSNAIVFIGNSLTQYFELNEFFKNTNIKNRGIAGDFIDGVTNRLESVIQMQPKKIFIEIGINDLGAGISKDTVIFKYQKLINLLVLKLPNTKIYVQSLFPTEIGSVNFPTHCTKKVNEDIVMINAELLKYSEQRQITFVDTYHSFVLNGVLNPKYSVDGVHLNGTAYKLWAEIVKPYVNE